VLTGPEIERQIALERIVIDPYDPTAVGPNSIDVRLAPELVGYDVDLCEYSVLSGYVLDARRDNPTWSRPIHEEGVVLMPGRLYLARTVERTHTPFHVPQISGRSSVGRLGIRIHATAGFGDVGFNGTWTLEIDVVHPVRVYAGMRIAQLYFTEPVGELRQYTGRYQGETDVVASRMWTDTDKRKSP